MVYAWYVHDVELDNDAFIDEDDDDVVDGDDDGRVLDEAAENVLLVAYIAILLFFPFLS